MEEFTIKQAEFLTSAGKGSAYPAACPCEIAIVGRSNVGKSSLINAMCRNNKLARTSAQPGKTRLINFFLINRAFYLVDLPGYGFAKASKEEQKSWGALMESYLASGRVTHLLLLLDIRHEPTEADRMMFRYLTYYNIPFTLVATKADKLPVSKRAAAANACAKQLGAPPYAIAASSDSFSGVLAVVKRIGDVYRDAVALFTADSQEMD